VLASAQIVMQLFKRNKIPLTSKAKFVVKPVSITTSTIVMNVIKCDLINRRVIDIKNNLSFCADARFFRCCGQAE